MITAEPYFLSQLRHSSIRNTFSSYLTTAFHNNNSSRYCCTDSSPLPPTTQTHGELRRRRLTAVRHHLFHSSSELMRESADVDQVSNNQNIISHPLHTLTTRRQTSHGSQMRTMPGSAATILPRARIACALLRPYSPSFADIIIIITICLKRRSGQEVLGRCTGCSILRVPDRYPIYGFFYLLQPVWCLCEDYWYSIKSY